MGNSGQINYLTTKQVNKTMILYAGGACTFKFLD